MEYRKAVLSDIDTLAQMRIDMLCEETTHSLKLNALIRDNTIQYISQGIKENSYVSWIAALNNQIISMSGVNFFVLPPNDWCPYGQTAYIGNLYTVPTFRKQGIGSQLLNFVIEEAKSRGCERILLNTTDMGKPLYEKLGFQGSSTAMALYPFGIIPSL